MFELSVSERWRSSTLQRCLIQSSSSPHGAFMVSRWWVFKGTIPSSVFSFYYTYSVFLRSEFLLLYCTVLYCSVHTYWAPSADLLWWHLSLLGPWCVFRCFLYFVLLLPAGLGLLAASASSDSSLNSLLHRCNRSFLCSPPVPGWIDSGPVLSFNGSVPALFVSGVQMSFGLLWDVFPALKLRF